MDKEKQAKKLIELKYKVMMQRIDKLCKLYGLLGAANESNQWGRVCFG